MKAGTEKIIENNDCREMTEERLMILFESSRVQQKHARYQQLRVKWTL